MLASPPLLPSDNVIEFTVTVFPVPTFLLLKDDVTDKLRSEDIAVLASELSSIAEVRDSLFDIQRAFYTNKGLVADGRDMGTVVFKDAKLKITTGSHVMSPEQWIASVMRMEKIRESKS